MGERVDAVDFSTLGLLLFVAAIVAMVTRRLKLPYSAGLVAAGIALALLPLGLDLRLQRLVEAESLLNDGVAAVGFALLVAVAAGEAPGLTSTASKLATTAFGGIAVGAAVTAPLLLLAGRTTDRLVELTLTALAAFGAFLFAEHFHMSGVLAALTAGMIVGNIGWMGSISDSGRPAVLGFWEF